MLRLTSQAPYTGIGFDEVVTANGVLTGNQWHHIAAVNNEGDRKVYINGSDSGVFLMYSSGHSKYTYAGGSTIVNLNANDYFTIYGETKLHISNETNFSACLLQAY